MKYLFTLVIILSFAFSASAQVMRKSPMPNEPLPRYNPSLAKELGADANGMRKYVMAFLKKGPNTPKNKTKAAELQKAHMSNIKRLAEDGKLAIAGPFLDNGELRGIYIFNVETIEEAKKLTETDPAIKAGSLIMELHPWYGSAALGMVNKYHNRLIKDKK